MPSQFMSFVKLDMELVCTLWYMTGVAAGVLGAPEKKGVASVRPSTPLFSLST